MHGSPVLLHNRENQKIKRETETKQSVVRECLHFFFFFEKDRQSRRGVRTKNMCVCVCVCVWRSVTAPEGASRAKNKQQATSNNQQRTGNWDCTSLGRRIGSWPNRNIRWNRPHARNTCQRIVSRRQSRCHNCNTIARSRTRRAIPERIPHCCNRGVAIHNFRTGFHTIRRCNDVDTNNASHQCYW